MDEVNETEATVEVTVRASVIVEATVEITKEEHDELETTFGELSCALDSKMQSAIINKYPELSGWVDIREIEADDGEMLYEA